MANGVLRRPLPALLSLVALLLLTAIVWWRVLHRDDSSANSSGSCPTPSPSATHSTAGLPAASSIIVSVLNSTKRNGIAGGVRTTLIADGFRVPGKATNDPSPTKAKNTGTAQIRYGPTGKAAADHLRYYFPGANLVPTTSKTATVVVALGAKYHAVPSKTAVAAAMKKASVTVASAAPGTAPATPGTC